MVSDIFFSIKLILICKNMDNPHIFANKYLYHSILICKNMGIAHIFANKYSKCDYIYYYLLLLR